METPLQKIKEFCQDQENEFSVLGDEPTKFQLGFISAIREIHELCEGIKPTKMKFKNAPIGSRFRFADSNDVYVKIHSEGDGLVVKWNGCVEGHQSHCCWIDDETDFDTEIKVF